MVTHQAKIISYNNDFWLMTLTVIPPLILLFFLAAVRQEGLKASC